MATVFGTVWCDNDRSSVKRFYSYTGAYYVDELCKLREALKSKRRGKLLRGVRLLHDNAPAHTSAFATSAAAEYGYELLPHPLYSPDLAPSDFYLFPLLKKHFSGTHFSSGNDVIASVEVFLQGQNEQSSTRLVYKSCRNDGTSALKLADIVWKNKLVIVAVLCFFIYDAGNFWNNPHMSNYFDHLLSLTTST